MRHSISAHRTFLRPQARADPQSSVRFPMRLRANRPHQTPSRAKHLLVTSLLLCFISSFCVGVSTKASTTRNTEAFLLESNPTNLDPRFATHAWSHSNEGLLF